ncbi:hypothetical protein R5W24_006490 [Gemmata sp. JC717]|uniref:hypothetical protein n=1 Tax=Gemmata algarum TaxID=2975278 RepID=UPI0021BACA96|nr:hypothetical protein [Gemmata algarum]MDY3557302.1 hypothetical protein [Gemmata algarum]
MKKAERVAKALAREARREQYAREEAAMQAFLRECRASLPTDVWDKEFVAAERSAGETWHVVEWMVFVLNATQHPITPALRQALDAMLDARGLDRHDPRCGALRHLNYGAYWKSQYGY